MHHDGISFCLILMSFSFCSFCVCLHFCFCFFSCNPHLGRFGLWEGSLLAFLLTITKRVRSEQSLAKCPSFPQLKHPFGLSPKSLLGPLSSRPLNPESLLSLSPLYPPRSLSPPLLLKSLFPLLLEISTLISLPSINLRFMLNNLKVRKRKCRKAVSRFQRMKLGSYASMAY